MSGAVIALQRFSTDDLPERDRVAMWCDGFARVALNTTFDPIVDRPFRQVGAFCALENLGVSLGESNGLVSWRSKTQLADSNDDLILNVNRLGSTLSSQMGRELQLDPGEAVLLTCSELLAHKIPGPFRGLSLRMPRNALANLVSDPEGNLMRRVPADSPALQLLLDYVGMVTNGHELSSPALQRAFVTHVHDLVALTVGATRDAIETARWRGVRAARLKAIKTDIVNRIADEALSVGDIARRHRVTPRYVQMLFEAEGQTFTEFVISQRLILAHRKLMERRFSDQTISAIAFEVGFSNLSYFNRVFRRHFGATPSELRLQRRESPVAPI